MNELASSASFSQLAAITMQRCERIALETDIPGTITRTFCSPAMAASHQLLRGWMQAAGLTCRCDAVCNLFGTTTLSSNLLPQSRSHCSSKPRLLIGSHIDTVPNGGMFDGLLGILLGLAVVESFGDSVHALPFDIEIVAFSEEEGVRYRSPYIGSRALSGFFQSELLQRTDDKGICFEEAVRQFGGNCNEIDSCRLDRSAYIGFLEAHIEQGPVLESESRPLAVVTGIAGQTRATARFVGRAAHAGTTPMHLRRDAMAAAAQWIQCVELIAQETPGLMATIGHLMVQPNVPNVIPGEVALRLDARHLEDSVRRNAVRELQTKAEMIAQTRNLQFVWERTEEQSAVRTDVALTTQLAAAMFEAGMDAKQMPSGAGHDAVIMSQVLPTAMLFLRCKEGISHHPDESVKLEDVEAAIRVMHHFVQHLSLNFC